jgi:cytidine deaminase
MHIELYAAAKQLICRRYPTGWGGAAALATESGRILTSVAPDTKNDSLSHWGDDVLIAPIINCYLNP